MNAIQKTIPQYATLHTDGACKGNPGPSGWAFILQIFSDGVLVKQIEKSGHMPLATNNQAELTAMNEGLKVCPDGIPIDAFTDSEYVQLNGTERLPNWKGNGWRTAAKKDVKNKELWVQFDLLKEAKTPKLIWVKGYAENSLNKRADHLAKKAAQGIIFDEANYFDADGNPTITSNEDQNQ